VTWRAAVIQCQTSDRRLVKAYSDAQALLSAGEKPSEGPDEALARAIASLPREQLAALALLYLVDMRVVELVVALDIPPRMVKTRPMHAQHKLRALLEGETNDPNG
jgi:DNA-directed RNA polymerase specialized sigma24 family protein